ncbi:MAG TPA: ATP synthase F1 subunit delta, partial [Sphingomonadales bacterium]|nr:ATP synthase F1 subunit delta [Sphingomonadales bacterium]
MSSNRMIASGLEGRYALAVFALALEQKALDAVENDLAGLSSLAQESADFANFLSNPSLDKDTQHKAFAAIAKKAKFHKLTVNFLGVLIENRRLSRLEKIASVYSRLLADYRGEVEAQVTSAEKITPAQATALKKQLKKIL